MLTLCFLKLCGQADQAKADTRPVCNRIENMGRCVVHLCAFTRHEHKGKKESSTRLPLIGDLETACQNQAKRCPGAQGWHDVGRAASETGRGGL